MNSLIVISWVTMGFFAAWIATHVARDRSRGGGIGNLAVAVLGALLGGLAMHAILHGRHGYNPFTWCAVAALCSAIFLLGLTRFFPRRAQRRVS